MLPEGFPFHQFNFIQEEFLKLQFKNLLYGPVPYIDNRSEQFENVWQGTTSLADPGERTWLAPLTAADL